MIAWKATGDGSRQRSEPHPQGRIVLLLSISLVLFLAAFISDHLRFMFALCLSYLRQAHTFFGVWSLTAYVMVHKQTMFYLRECPCAAAPLELEAFLVMLRGSIELRTLPRSDLGVKW